MEALRGEAFIWGGKFSLGCAFWQLLEIGGEGSIWGLGLCMAVLVGLQYTGTLPTVHRYVLYFINFSKDSVLVLAEAQAPWHSVSARHPVSSADWIAGAPEPPSF